MKPIKASSHIMIDYKQVQLKIMLKWCKHFIHKLLRAFLNNLHVDLLQTETEFLPNKTTAYAAHYDTDTAKYRKNIWKLVQINEKKLILKVFLNVLKYFQCSRQSNKKQKILHINKVRNTVEMCIILQYQWKIFDSNIRV